MGVGKNFFSYCQVKVLGAHIGTLTRSYVMNDEKNLLGYSFLIVPLDPYFFFLHIGQCLMRLFWGEGETLCFVGVVCNYRKYYL